QIAKAPLEIPIGSSGRARVHDQSGGPIFAHDSAPECVVAVDDDALQPRAFERLDMPDHRIREGAQSDLAQGRAGRSGSAFVVAVRETRRREEMIDVDNVRAGELGRPAWKLGVHVTDEVELT